MKNFWLFFNFKNVWISIIFESYIDIYLIFFFKIKFYVWKSAYFLVTSIQMDIFFTVKAMIPGKNVFKWNFDMYLLCTHMLIATFCSWKSCSRWSNITMYYCILARTRFTNNYLREDFKKTVRSKLIFISEFHFWACILPMYRKSEISIWFKF